MRDVASQVKVAKVPLGDPRMKDFVAFHWDLYDENPYWCPQFDADLLGNRLLGMTGLFTPEHPYHRSSTAMHFLAYRGEDIVGRVSVVVNDRFNEYYDVKVAFFGCFECVEDFEVAQALLDSARSWATDQGATVLRGPGEYCNITHERQGCLIDGFDQDVYVEHVWNPPYYQGFIEQYGFEKTMDYHAYLIDLKQPIGDRLHHVAEGVRAKGHIETRALDMSRFDEDLKLVISIYNQAWAQNWGFLPVTDWEADALAESLKPIIDPELCRFAYYKGEPVAVLGAFPDPNYATKPRWKLYGDSDYARIARLFRMRRSIPRVRLIFFGIVPGFRRLGADALLYEEVYEYAIAKGYTTVDVSLLLEVNELIIRSAESMGGKRYKTWRIWDLPLG